MSDRPSPKASLYECLVASVAGQAYAAPKCRSSVVHAVELKHDAAAQDFLISGDAPAGQPAFGVSHSLRGVHLHQPRSDLQQLVDEQRLDDLLRAVSVEEIGDAWRCYHERAIINRGISYDDADWWAVEFWLSNGLGFQRQEVARSGLVALVRAVPDDMLEYVGAGPIENFILPDEELVSWLEDEAQRDPRFRAALSFVYLSQEQPWVFERLRRVLDDPNSAR